MSLSRSALLLLSKSIASTAQHEVERIRTLMWRKRGKKKCALAVLQLCVYPSAVEQNEGKDIQMAGNRCSILWSVVDWSSYLHRNNIHLLSIFYYHHHIKIVSSTRFPFKTYLQLVFF
jgi:hypothetical protein